MKKNKKTIVIIVSVTIGCIILYFGVGEYQKYAKKKELQDRITYLESKIEAIESGDYSSVQTVDTTVNDVNPFYLSDFSARADGTMVKAFGSIENQLLNPVDEVVNIAFFDKNGELIRVKAINVELDGGESMYFEELIGLTTDGTPIPVSAKLTD